ncbi:unnamed protein product [Calypogeia fissa]
MAGIVQVAAGSLAASATSVRGVSIGQQQQQRSQGARRCFVLRVRAEATAETSTVLNPGIKKEVDKVVDTVEVSGLSKPMTAYCRCWRSGTFPLCDGTHAKYNKATGDNVGPLLVKK